VANEALRAIQTALGNVGDDLYRARLQQGADSSWRSGNGESIGEVVAGYERHRDAILNDAEKLGISRADLGY
jgi:hypothetical protein